MNHACTLALTLKGLAAWAERAHRPDARSVLEPKIIAFIDLACRPILALPLEERRSLASRVSERAMVSLGARFDLLAALADTVEDEETTLHELVESAGEWAEALRSRAAHLFSEDAIGCFEIGMRIHERAALRLLDLLERADWAPFVRADRASQFYELAHLTSCLDIALTSLLLYVEEDAAPERSAIPEELCFLVREYALAHAALANVLLASKPNQERVAEAALSDEDLRSDLRFSSLVLPDLIEQLR